MIKKRNPNPAPQGEPADKGSPAAGPEFETTVGSESVEPELKPEVQPAAGTGSGEEADADMPLQAAEGHAEMAARLAKTEGDFKTLSDRYLRLMAEYDNFRRRTQKEREALYTDSVAGVVKEWLPVIDNLARAEQAAKAVEGETAQRIAEGVTMVLKQVNEVMERLNVREIDCLGQDFDPNVADAVMHVEDESAGPSTVVEILQKGYACGDRIIRHCMVKVAN